VAWGRLDVARVDLELQRMPQALLVARERVRARAHEPAAEQRAPELASEPVRKREMDLPFERRQATEHSPSRQMSQRLEFAQRSVGWRRRATDRPGQCELQRQFALI